MTTKRTLRLLLGIWSPSRLAVGDPFELALLWAAHRLSQRFWLYRALLGEVDAGALGHLWLWHQVRDMRVFFRDAPVLFRVKPEDHT